MVETGRVSSDVEEIDENQPDISDQMTSYNTPLRKGLKWYRKLSFALILCMAVVNAWIVYNSIKGKKTQIKTFRESITRALLGVELPKRNPKPKCNLKHVLKYMLKDDGKRIRRACKLCYEETKKKYGRAEARKKANKLLNFLIYTSSYDQNTTFILYSSLLTYCILNVICLFLISLYYTKTASNKYSLIEGKTLYCKLNCKPYQRKVSVVDSNLRINSTSHCVFSDAIKLNLIEGVFEK
ncbi:hypothetical protein Anas_11685 [Armadillidium nasatum]|uniref:PiggyBac transposable element-derived protein domain-containing protein n=1 Tax=Armadillidium nasatum TaxID=96803 RepID=A0A5N5T5E9_9CRUS|nr:hypothetical protein Anas_11685 [Armadillidium nasatum]